MRQRTAQQPEPSRLSSRQGPFQFDPGTRQRLVRVLGRQIVKANVIIALLEAQANSFLLLRPSDGRLHSQLHDLGVAVRNLSDRLNVLCDDATYTVLNRLSFRGYDSRFIQQLREGLQLLAEATEPAGDGLPQRRPGRPQEAVRAWLARNVRITLEDGGVDVHSRRGARALSECLRSILSALGESVPDDMGPLLDEARLP
jgi:hypothetical protein